MKTMGNELDECINYSLIFFNRDSEITYAERNLNVYVWPQTWSNTGSGFMGISGQAITTCPTFVIENTATKHVLVFHNGQLAYHVKVPNEIFWSDFEKKEVVGESKYHKQYEEPDAQSNS